MDNRGQAEAVFRLMIDSIIGIAILLIIISTVTYFNGQVIEQSRTDLINILQNAVNTPDGAIIKSGDLTFAQGFIIDASFMPEWVGYSGNCFSFDARQGSIKILDSGGRAHGAEFIQNLTTKVYVQCKPSASSSLCDPKTTPENENECCFTCLVSFGKQIE